MNNNWYQTVDVGKVNFLCGYCSKEVAPNKGYYCTNDLRGGNTNGKILICPNCTQPTYIDPSGQQTPKPRIGKDVEGITNKDIEILHLEARNCTSAGAFTAAVMVCRKILMNLAVQHGADQNEKFAYYVGFLDNKGYIPPQGKQWVDAIRKRGNDANHEIALMDKDDAQLILHFTEALLRFNFELPHILEIHNKL